MEALQAAQNIFDQLVAWRRDFHRHPELGLDTIRTAGVVAETLREYGYMVQEGIAQNGVIGLLQNGEGPVVMTRVDMDALPIHEANDVPYASQTPGMMHACGHDAHIAIGLGIAKLMAEHREGWQGTLKLIFQPGEEGANGADIMVKEGALDNPRPQAALALHVWNQVPYGLVAASSGPVMAAAEAFRVTITGKGGHGALPDKAVDPVVIAAMTINNLQTVVSRNVGALETAVVSVCSLQSGEAFNVIPDTAELRGTIRTYEPEVRERVLARVRAIVEGTAEMMGGAADLEMMAVTPALVNDPSVTALVQKVIQDLLGPDVLTSVKTMGSEDAAFFQQIVPGCYIFVGSGPEDYAERSHHNPKFEIDERAMISGVAVMVTSLCRLMPSGEGA